MKKPTKSFKAEMNLPKLIEQFGSDDKCRAQLASLRWPKGVTCPRCESQSISNSRSATNTTATRAAISFP